MRLRYNVRLYPTAGQRQALARAFQAGERVKTPRRPATSTRRRFYCSPCAEGGRGLLLVDLLAERWGVCDDAAGRTVWFEVKAGGL